MADGTGIEWTDATWNPVRGCSRVSEGCRHCYAERVASRFSGPGQPYHGLAVVGQHGPKWTGEVRLVPEHLADPIRWQRPRRIFVNSMSDLFHEKLSDMDIERVFGVMALAQRHTFQILTKRAGRMAEWFNPPGIQIEDRATMVSRAAAHIGGITWDGRGSDPNNYLNVAGGASAANIAKRRAWPGWPLPNVWMGVSVEDQAAADERIPFLLETPAAVRWVSAEPLLGPVDLSEYLDPAGAPCGETNETLDWVVCGGESGPGARPMHPAWARALRDQCAAHSTAYLFKQWGEWRPMTYQEQADSDPARSDFDTHTVRVGKKKAGRELDGRLWDGYPDGGR